MTNIMNLRSRSYTKNIMFLPLPLLLTFLLTSNIICDKISPIVQTHLGGIRGLYRRSFSGRQFEAYEGVPYALPPLLDRRFQPPEPIHKWTGNLTATKSGGACIQFAHVPNKLGDHVEGNEDCLYLNIYVPNHDSNQSLAVLFYIHGGALSFGSAPTGAKFLMDYDIIVVTINYRLGIFGFLSTEDEVVSGNMGLKDQSLALRWVSENIRYFGGDSNRVTLMGHSAGAASVHYHYLSPMSRGLFQNGLSLSGVASGLGSPIRDAREKATELASVLECPVGNTSEIVECLRSRPVRAIAQATSHFKKFLSNPFIPFGPVTEKHSDKPFINRTPIEIISSGDAVDVPWFTSLVSEEGLFRTGEFIENDQHLRYLNKHWNEIAPHMLNFNSTIPLEKHLEVSQKIREHYLGFSPINKTTVDQLVAMVGDRLYVVDGENAARLQAKINKSPVYFWYYSYRALTNSIEHFTETRRDFGVSHGDDKNMIFESHLIDPLRREEDRDMQVKMLDLVVSITKNGVADLDSEFGWKKVDPYKEELEFLHIAGANDIRMDSNRNLGQKRFWSTIETYER